MSESKRPAPQREWKIGEVVRLVSGGPRMTIRGVGIMPFDPIECLWFHEGKVEWSLFPPRSLKRVRGTDV